MGANKKEFEKIREEENFLSDLSGPKSDLKKIDLIKQINKMVERVNEGYENELEIYVLFSNVEKRLKQAKTDILENALIERKKYEEKTLEIFGKKISISQSGRFDYSGSEKWNKKNTELKEIQEQMKNSYLAAKTDKTIIDKNGEIIEPAVYRASKESLKIQ